MKLVLVMEVMSELARSLKETSVRRKLTSIYTAGWICVTRQAVPTCYSECCAPLRLTHSNQPRLQQQQLNVSELLLSFDSQTLTHTLKANLFS